MLNYAIPFFTWSLMKQNLNAFSLWVKYQIFCDVYGATVVIFYQDNSEINFVITYLMFNPYSLCINTTRNNIFYLRCGCYTFLFIAMLIDKRVTKYLTHITSIFPIQFATIKIRVRVPYYDIIRPFRVP